MTTTTPDFTPRLVPAPPRGHNGTPRVDWQRLWLGTQSRPWSSLAVVPGDEQTSAYELAGLLAALGVHHGEPMVFASARDTDLDGVAEFVEQTRWHQEHGERVIFATRALSENLATLPLAQAADAALLCVTLGRTSLAPATDAVERIGRARFLGSVIVPAIDRSTFTPPRNLEPRRLWRA